MPVCVVPGCAREAVNNLSIRLRRPDTSAIWAPNMEAFVCDEHAITGARIHVLYEATSSGEIETHVHGWASEPARTTEIRQHAQKLAEDLSDAARDAAVRRASL